MTVIEGQFFEGIRPVGVPARMEFTDREAVLTAGCLHERYEMSNLMVSPRIGSTDRFIFLSDGGQFGCADHFFLDVLPQESPSEGPVAWLEKRWGVALACTAVIFLVLLAGYFFGLPAAAERIVARIPVETEASLGNQAMAWLDKKKWLEPTDLEPEARTNITADFNRLCSNLPMESRYRLEFRSSELFRANAFALPGGIVVITDEMVNTAETPEEVMAVLAHEVGHVELRHAMRSVLQDSVVAAAVAAITSDAASLNAVVAGLPAMVAQNGYSREFETSADHYAFSLLKRRGISPEAFASIMERLVLKEGDEAGKFPYVSTHPAIMERVRSARDAAAE
ncbi:MAG: M48 family metallopeptidase [Deltaproteobacteria bacterium]|nr:M48 family metallopeptidase [Deltaproteobacteria bacterium]